MASTVASTLKESNSTVRTWLLERNLALIALGVLIVYVVERLCKRCYDEVLVPAVQTGTEWAQQVVWPKIRRWGGFRVPLVEEGPGTVILVNQRTRNGLIVVHCRRMFLAFLEFLVAVSILYFITLFLTRRQRRKGASKKEKSAASVLEVSSSTTLGPATTVLT